MLLSIVISTYNRSSFLKKNLFILKNALRDTPCVEIIVIDDYSSTNHSEINYKTCLKHSVKYFRSRENCGPAFSRNIGISMAKGEWISFLDDDVYVDNDWFKNLKKKITSCSEDVLGIEGATHASGKGLWDREVENLEGGLFLTSNITYRRNILKKCKGFDEQFIGPFAEDQEFALRVKKWGKIVFLKCCIVYHMPRDINPVKHLLGTFKRMNQFLNAEFHFYRKHKDRYHTVRYNSTFWESLSTILLKHLYIALKRRNISQLKRDPLQSIVLIFTLLLEQCLSWILTVKYIFLWNYNKNKEINNHFNVTETAKLWKFNPEHCDLLQFNPNFFRSIHFRVKKYPVYSSTQILTETNKKSRLISPNIYIRIDDIFLEQKELVNEFLKAIDKLYVPFLAAIKGQDLINKSNKRIIKMISDTGGEIGVHGYNHTGKYGPYDSEILQLSFPELDRLSNIEYNGVFSQKWSPSVFIPPFNAISWEQILYLSRKYDIICGGPESARFTNYLFGPIVLNTGSLYFPSFFPFYGSASDMLNSGFQNLVMNSKAPLCLTFHLHTEALDGFFSLTRCITEYKNHINSWNCLLLKKDTC